MLLVDNFLLQPDQFQNDYREYHCEMKESESPETARCEEEDNDCRHSKNYQRLSSHLLCDDNCRSAEKKDTSNIGFNALSPIVNDGIDMTIFGNDQSCGVGCTYDLFESPNWLKISEKCSESEFSVSTKRVSAPSIDDEEEFCESNLFARLSINPGEPQFDDVPLFKDRNHVKETQLQAQKRKKKMKQTTVTFFYDSDEEIKENLDCNSDFDSLQVAYRADNQNKIRSNFGVRNALGLQKKNIQTSSSLGLDSVDGATLSLRNRAFSSSGRGSCVNTSMANAALLNWIKSVGVFIDCKIMHIV